MSHRADEPIAQLRAAIAVKLRDSAGSADAVAQVCTASIGFLPVNGASISVISGTNHHETLHASDETSAAVEDLQFTLGEGPGFEAVSHHRPVLTANLATDSAPAWPVFATKITSHPVEAIFTSPLKNCAGPFGTLTFYRHTSGGLTSDELNIALQLADLATTAVLLQFGHSDLDPDRAAATLPNGREIVHQAVGFLMGACRISATDALTLLRSYAFTTDVTVEQVAADLTNRRIQPTDITN